VPTVSAHGVCSPLWWPSSTTLRSVALKALRICQATAKNGPEAPRNLAPLCEALTKGSEHAAVQSPLEQSSRDAALESPEVVQAILGLTAAGWGRRRIAQELGCSPEAWSQTPARGFAR
jgi:hypothetical protein